MELKFPSEKNFILGFKKKLFFQHNQILEDLSLVERKDKLCLFTLNLEVIPHFIEGN